MDRRLFLKSAGLVAGALGAGVGFTACSRGPIPGGEQTLAVQSATFEVLTGQDRPVAFGVRTLDNEDVAARDFEVYLRSMEGDVVGGPFAAEYEEAAGTGIGIYLTSFDLEREGPVELVAVDGRDWGAAALNVKAPEHSAAPVPGQQAIATPTPTLDNANGYTRICTQDPPCGMHEVSLDEALTTGGQPVAVLFATPAYCQTAVCGPAVATLDGIRGSRGWSGMRFIHCEIYTDEGQTLGDPVQVWDLPTEPWLFTIAGDGTILDRLDGPMVPSAVTAMLERAVA